MTQIPRDGRKYERTNEQTNERTYERKDENYIPLGINAGGIIKGCYPVANLRKTTIYNTNKNLVNDDVYTKFGLWRPMTPRGLVNLDPRGMIGRIYEGYH